MTQSVRSRELPVIRRYSAVTCYLQKTAYAAYPDKSTQSAKDIYIGSSTACVPRGMHLYVSGNIQVGTSWVRKKHFHIKFYN